MFKRLTTSLTKPPYVVFFLNDSWLRVIIYFLLIPIFLIIPLIIKQAINPGMNIDRYEKLVSAIQSDLLGHDMKIINGILEGDEIYITSFDYISLHLGYSYGAENSFVISLDNNEMTFRMMNIEIFETSYESLGLLDFDFSINTTEQARILASVIREFYNQQIYTTIHEMSLFYVLNLTYYLIYIMTMPLIMMILFRNNSLFFSQKIKLSIYLTTIYFFAELLFILFNLRNLEFLSMLMLYIYHFWAYRSIIVIKKEV
jgi:hypothetical protein